MKNQEFKSTNQKVTELLNSNFTVKNIFDLINFASNNEVGEALIDLIAENANDFTKDVAKKFQEGIELTQKQVWCLAYQIFNNKEVYILAQIEYVKSCEELEIEENNVKQIKEEKMENSILVLRTGNGVNGMLLHNNRKDEMIFTADEIETANLEFKKEENCLKNTYKTTSFLRETENWNDKFEPKESDLVRVELMKATKDEDGEIEIIETVNISDDFYCGK